MYNPEWSASFAKRFSVHPGTSSAARPYPIWINKHGSYVGITGHRCFFHPPSPLQTFCIPAAPPPSPPAAPGAPTHRRIRCHLARSATMDQASGERASTSSVPLPAHRLPSAPANAFHTCQVSRRLRGITMNISSRTSAGRGGTCATQLSGTPPRHLVRFALAFPRMYVLGGGGESEDGTAVMSLALPLVSRWTPPFGAGGQASVRADVRNVRRRRAGCVCQSHCGPPTVDRPSPTTPSCASSTARTTHRRQASLPEPLHIATLIPPLNYPLPVETQNRSPANPLPAYRSHETKCNGRPPVGFLRSVRDGC
ncbi:hypothetical protein OH77DRAFT_814678 [Trametes cingulata]|nr:hypothetical protein OH77DRAFT_814678 [Trametes cingulata]